MLSLALQQRLSTYFSLGHKVTLSVPSESNGNPLPQAKHAAIVRHVRTELARICGGGTVTQGLGDWVNGAGILISEPVTLCSSHCGDLNPIIEDILDLATWVKTEAKQESVSLEIDETRYFI